MRTSVAAHSDRSGEEHPVWRSQRSGVLFGAVAVLLVEVGGCSSQPPVAVEGETQRVVGETVTLELLRGDPAFSGRLRMFDAADTEYNDTALRPRLKDDRTLSFVVPSAAAAGTARVFPKQIGTNSEYEVRLELSRFAVVSAASGEVSLIPLPPSTADPVPLGSNSAPTQVSLSAGGDLLVTLSGDAVRFYRLAKTPEALVQLRVTGATSVAALANGALVGTPTSIAQVLLGDDQRTPKTETLSVTGTKALAVGDRGTHAVALAQCDSDVNSRCAIRIELPERSPPSIDSSVRLPATTAVRMIAVGREGNNAVVPDSGAIHGIAFGWPVPLSRLGWPSEHDWRDPAEPLAIATTNVLIGDELTDMFSIAEGKTRRIRSVGFIEVTDEKTGQRLLNLRDVLQVPPPFDSAPNALAFGHEVDLYVASGMDLFRADMAQPTPEPELLLLRGLKGERIQFLAVQR